MSPTDIRKPNLCRLGFYSPCYSIIVTFVCGNENFPFSQLTMGTALICFFYDTWYRFSFTTKLFQCPHLYPTSLQAQTHCLAM